MAAASSSDDDGGVISGINVTPLVDICLVLLIIMMVTARIIANLSVPLDLPKAAKGQDLQVFFRIDLSKDGETYVDDKKLDDPKKVLGLAKEALAKNPEIRATIRADAAVPHGRVMQVVDLLKQSGMSRIAFGVSPTPAEPGALPTPEPGK
ncbi:MAG TPA: biopolymer transporter ExbD [Polyangiaceae bacterium]|nr:biopolymer transporter ExbD [Polyangiaceae bacterium]